MPIKDGGEKMAFSSIRGQGITNKTFSLYHVSTVFYADVAKNHGVQDTASKACRPSTVNWVAENFRAA